MEKCKINENVITVGNVSVIVTADEGDCGCVNIKVCCNKPTPPEPTVTPTFMP